MRMFGVESATAILVDATLVRIILVPAFMPVLGRANWCAPKPFCPAAQPIWLPTAIRTPSEGDDSSGTSPRRLRGGRGQPRSASLNFNHSSLHK
jgi:uncharacterized membrane protein YdfJ with MMPL/SSD domain